MKKLIALLCVVLLSIGCNIDGSGSGEKSGNSKKLVETTCQIQFKSNIKLQPGDLFTYDCSGNKRIVVTEATQQIIRQRPSCSGFDTVSPDGLGIGDTLSVLYGKDDVTYVNGTTIRATAIEAYRSECINGNLPGEEDGCSTCDFFN